MTLLKSYTNILPCNLISKKPIFCFSLKRLNANYGGNIVTLRRSSDNAIKSFKATKYNILDVNQIKDFADGGDLFVTTWYDQSSNSNNIAQTAASHQPQLKFADGYLEIDFLGSRFLTRFDSKINWQSNDFTVLTRAKKYGETDYRGIFTNRFAGAVNWITFGQADAAGSVGDMAVETGGGVATYIRTNYFARNNGKIFYTITKDTKLTIYVNISLLANHTLGVNDNLGDASNLLRVGMWFDAAQAWDGTIDELIFYDSKLTNDEITTVREALIK